MNHLRFAALSLLSIATATGQDQAAPRTPTFTLSAGDHNVASLVELTAQVRGRPMELDAETTSLLRRRTVVVQRELRLEADAFVDVTTTLLHGYDLVFPAPQYGNRIVRIESAFAAELFVTRSPQQILTNVSGIEYARTVAMSHDPIVHMNALRPLFGWGGPHSLDIQAGDDELVLTGTSDKIRCALKVLALLEGTEPAATSQPTFADGPTIAWPGGKMAADRFVAKFATALDANVVGELSRAELDLGERAQLTPEGWYARATKALFEAQLVLVPSIANARLFTMRSLHGNQARQFTWHADYVPSECIANRDVVDPTMTTVTLHNISANEAMRNLLPKLATATLTSIGTINEDTFLLCGPRPCVADLVAAIRSLDEAQ